MKLEIGNIEIKEVVLGEEEKIENGTLTLDPTKIKELVLEDDRLADCEIEIAKPGECSYHTSKRCDRTKMQS